MGLPPRASKGWTEREREAEIRWPLLSLALASPQIAAAGEREGKPPESGPKPPHSNSNNPCLCGIWSCKPTCEQYPLVKGFYGAQLFI